MAPTPRVEVRRYQGDLSNPDRATAQTIAVMCDQIESAARDPAVQNAARDAVRRFRGGPFYIRAGADASKNPGAIAESCWWAAKAALRFEHHEDRIQIWFNERDQLQLLISPTILVRYPSRGDCAIYTLLICAFLRALNQPFEIVTAAVDPRDPSVFGHVYPRAVMPDGTRITLDASHGSYPGWEVLPNHILRKQVWDQDGNPIPDQAPRFKGLHGYRGMRGYMGGAGFPIGLRGLGQLTTVDASGNIIDENGNILGNVSSTPNTGINVPTTPTGSTAPNPFLTSLASSVPGLLQSWTTIGGRVLAPTVQYTGPGGVTYSAPAGSAAAFPPSLSSLGSSSLLPILLIGGVLVLFMVGGRK